MRRHAVVLVLAVVVFVLLLASIGDAGVTHGAGPFYNSAAPDTSVVVSTIGISAGCALVISIYWEDNGPTRTISSVAVQDNANADIRAATKADRTSIDHTQVAILKQITAGGNKTVTVTMDGSAYVAAGVYEYCGQDTTTQPDAEVGTAGTTGVQSTTITTATNSAAVTALIDTNGGEPTAGASYVLWGTRPNLGVWQEDEDDLDAGIAGAKTVDFSDSGSGSPTWSISAVAIKPAGGGGGGGQVPARLLMGVGQ